MLKDIIWMSFFVCCNLGLGVINIFYTPTTSQLLNNIGNVVGIISILVAGGGIAVLSLELMGGGISKIKS